MLRGRLKSTVGILLGPACSGRSYRRSVAQSALVCRDPGATHSSRDCSSVSWLPAGLLAAAPGHVIP